MAVHIFLCPSVFHRALSAAFSPLRLLQRLPYSDCSAPEENQTVFVESTEEFRFVERLIPPSRVPSPPRYEGPAPSGWVSPADTPPSLPYGIRRELYKIDIN
uniref:Large ribosomal subunit protein mL49 n=1 Tax=Gouania willdenowi TaxID=441366 RepID=A0A8C5DTS6_GOUWI